MGDWAHNLKLLSGNSINKLINISVNESHTSLLVECFNRRERKSELCSDTSVTALKSSTTCHWFTYFVLQHSHLNNDQNKMQFNSIQII